MGLFRRYIESTAGPLETLVQSFKAQYPGLTLYVVQHPDKISLMEIRLPKESRNQGAGTTIVRAIQQYAQSANLPIVLTPSPEPRMKTKLLSFYKRLGFKANTGRYKDYSLSNPFGVNWVWRPARTPNA